MHYRSDSDIVAAVLPHSALEWYLNLKFALLITLPKIRCYRSYNIRQSALLSVSIVVWIYDCQ